MQPHHYRHLPLTLTSPSPTPSQIINLAAPDTIDERAINKSKDGKEISIFKQHENLTLARNSAGAVYTVHCIVQYSAVYNVWYSVVLYTIQYSVVYTSVYDSVQCS